MINLEGQVALVTGASRGIGRACALKLAEAGADVIVNYLSSHSAATAVAGQIAHYGRRCAIVKADVSESEDVAEMIQFIREKFGRLDIVVSNAASGGFRPLMEAKRIHFDAAISTNVLGTLNLVQAARMLLERTEGRARVIALSSHGSHVAFPNYGVIGPSKAALESLVRHLALELGNSGVNFNLVLAGLIETDATRNMPGSQDLFNYARRRTLASALTLKVENIADAVVFLSSPLSDLIQGATLVVDGGLGIQS
ncbi:MAG: short-chain dehydrogenase/reductase [Schlesneria sp.]|nr:short-chain dehydrogenase/reductase [Schlesneria sp.]